MIVCFLSVVCCLLLVAYGSLLFIAVVYCLLLMFIFDCLCVFFSGAASLGPKIQMSEETVLSVDAKAAGKGKVTCKVLTPNGTELDMDVMENHDGTFDIYYTAPEPGKYVITIRFGGQNIPNSPFTVQVSITTAPPTFPSPYR